MLAAPEARNEWITLANIKQKLHGSKKLVAEP